MNMPSSATPYHPTTFLERGVAVPFTTPLLSGARARLAHNHGLELALRNPSGGPGVYVMPWAGINALCRPTLYDKVVGNRIAFLETLTPSIVRTIGRATAAEGLAGEAAMQAARAATRAEDNDRRAVIRQLLSTLIRQVSGVQSMPAGADELDLDTRARQTIGWLAPRLGQSAGWGLKALDTLAEAMTGAGVSDDMGRLPALIARLGKLRETIAEWAGNQRDSERIYMAHKICTIADHTWSLANTMLAETRRLALDTVGLLRHWAADPNTVSWIVERPEWLLDGWEQVCLIWTYAQDNAARRVALAEIAELIPVMPRELQEWGGGRPGMDDGFVERVERGRIGLNQDWRTGSAVFDLIARNEQLRAAAL